MESVTNGDGLVALQHYTSNSWDVEVKGQNGEVTRTYNFRPQHNISLAWVAPQDVDKLLAITVKSCCGKHQTRFHLASQINVNLFMTGNRHGTVE